MTKRTALAALTDAAVKVAGSQADMIVTRGGRIPRMFRTVELRSSQKHIYSIDFGKTWTIQAEGYAVINDVAGARFIMAPSVPVDGVERPNPYVIRDANGLITDVYVRGVLLARTLNGNLVPVTETVNVSPGDYFRAELLKITKMGEKWETQSDGKNRKVPMKDWGDNGRIVPLDLHPEDERGRRQGLEPNEALYPIDDTIGVVVNLKSPEIAKALMTRGDHLRFATRRATTILQRRLYSKHPGLPGQHLNPSDVTVTWDDPQSQYRKPVEAVARVNVLGWVEFDDGAAMRDLTMSVEQRLDQLPSVIDLGGTTGIAADEEAVAPPTERKEVDRAAAKAAEKAAELGWLDEANSVMEACRALPGGAKRLGELWAGFSDQGRPLEEQPENERDQFLALLVDLHTDLTREAETPTDSE